MNQISVLLKILSDSLLTSPNTFHNGDMLHRLQNTPAMTSEISDLVAQPLFKDIGRISRAIAKLAELSLLEKNPVSVLESMLDRFVGFSYNVFFDWDRYLTQHASKHMTPGKNRIA